MSSAIEDSVTFQGPVYLVKVKTGGEFGATDLLWAIGQVQGEPLDFSGMKSLVVGLNKKGLFAPKLVQGEGGVKTWGEIRTQVRLQAVQIKGEPITLFENVHSLYRIMHFAYESGILDNSEGLSILNSLTSVSGAEGGSRIKTFEEARKEAEMMVRPGTSGTQAVSVEMVGQWMEGVYGGVATYVEGHDGTLVQQYAGGMGDIGQVAAQGLGMGEGQVQGVEGGELGNGFDGSALFQRDTIVDGQGAFQVPNIGAELELRGNDHIFVDDMNEVDRMIEALEEEAGEDTNAGWRSKALRYKTLVLNLREKVKSVTKEKEKMARMNDLAQKRLHEYNAYSAAEVAENIKPWFAPIKEVRDRMDRMEKSVMEMGIKMSVGIRDGCQGVVDAVAKEEEGRKQENANLVQHLASRGLVNLGTSFDIPVALAEISEKVGKLGEPGTPLMDEVNPLDRFLFAKKEPQVPSLAQNVRGTPGQGLGVQVVQGLGQGVGVPRKDSKQALSVIMSAPGRRNTGPGILSTPTQFKMVQNNYLAVSKLGGQLVNRTSQSITPQGGELLRGAPIPSILGQSVRGGGVNQEVVRNLAASFAAPQNPGRREGVNQRVVRNREESFAAPQNPGRSAKGGYASKKTRWN